MATCCCLAGCGNTCGCVNCAGICLRACYIVTASGWTGVGALYFNKPVRVCYCGSNNGLGGKWSSCARCPIRVEYSFGNASGDLVDYYIANVRVAEYAPSGGGGCEDVRTFRKTIGVSGPATITVAPDTTVGEWMCECWSQQPQPATAHLNITNSTCPDVSNGTYTLSFDPSTGNYVGTVGNQGVGFQPGNTSPTFPPEGCDAPGSLILVTCNMRPCATNLGESLDLQGGSSCSCSPFFASGHTDLSLANGGLCDGGPATAGFDWTVTT